MQRLTAVALAAALIALTGCAEGGPSSSATAETAGPDARLAAQADSAWSDVTAKFPDALRPTVELERVIAPEDWVATMVECLHSEGFPGARTNGSGGIDAGSLPGAQAQSYSIARYTCSVRFPVLPEASETPSDEAMRVWYDYMLSEQIPCIEALGYSLAEPPSFEVFLEDYPTERQWTAGGEASGISAEAAVAVGEQCPMYPEGFWDQALQQYNS